MARERNRDRDRNRDRCSRFDEDSEGGIIGPVGAVIPSPTSPEYRRLLDEARDRAEHESEQEDP
jgi:hypothetical protein